MDKKQFVLWPGQTREDAEEAAALAPPKLHKMGTMSIIAFRSNDILKRCAEMTRLGDWAAHEVLVHFNCVPAETLPEPTADVSLEMAMPMATYAWRCGKRELAMQIWRTAADAGCVEARIELVMATHLMTDIQVGGHDEEKILAEEMAREDQLVATLRAMPQDHPAVIVALAVLTNDSETLKSMGEFLHAGRAFMHDRKKAEAFEMLMTAVEHEHDEMACGTLFSLDLSLRGNEGVLRRLAKACTTGKVALGVHLLNRGLDAEGIATLMEAGVFAGGPKLVYHGKMTEEEHMQHRDVLVAELKKIAFNVQDNEEHS